MAKLGLRTGWAGTFLAAGELIRRGYDVALTSGNTPSTDLLCAPPQGPGFRVEVKSVANPNFVLISRKVLEAQPKPDLFFVVVLVPEDLVKPPKFHVLPHPEVRDLWARMPKTKRDGTPYKSGFEGLNWGDVVKHQDRWDKLPK
jgi:hypothetical protein